MVRAMFGGKSREPRAASLDASACGLAKAEAGAVMTSFQACWNFSISLRVPTVMRT